MNKLILIAVFPALLAYADETELTDEQCRAEAIKAYLEAQAKNPNMGDDFYAAIGSNVYDQCTSSKKEKGEVFE